MSVNELIRLRPKLRMKRAAIPGEEKANAAHVDRFVREQRLVQPSPREHVGPMSLQETEFLEDEGLGKREKVLPEHRHPASRHVRKTTRTGHFSPGSRMTRNGGGDFLAFFGGVITMKMAVLIEQMLIVVMVAMIAMRGTARVTR